MALKFTAFLVHPNLHFTAGGLCSTAGDLLKRSRLFRGQYEFCSIIF